MFEITLIDHLRLTFGHIIYSQRAHAGIARSRARWSRLLRAGEALLIAGAAVSAAGFVAGRNLGGAVATAIFAGLALVLLLVDLILNLDRSAQVHWQCAVRFWGMREKYRALLSDLRDGAIDPDGARAGRNALLAELQSIYESAPAADPQAYESARQGAAAAIEGTALADEEIDLFLPPSLRKGKPATS